MYLYIQAFRYRYHIQETSNSLLQEAASYQLVKVFIIMEYQLGFHFTIVCVSI